MNNATTEEPETFPLCIEFWCEKYWVREMIIGWCNMTLRVAVSVLILILGTKMEKDFMRSITVSMFVPILATEIFVIYIEIASFVRMFCETPMDMYTFTESYLIWTDPFRPVLYDYIHYDCLVMLNLLLHCCRLACREGDEINPFPVKTLCLVLQVIPFFLCILLYVEGETGMKFKIVSILSRVVTIVGFIALTVQIAACFPPLYRLLPYEHAASVDMQLRDARSRLAWTLMYMIIPYLCLLPWLIEAVTWMMLDKMATPSVAAPPPTTTQLPMSSSFPPATTLRPPLSSLEYTQAVMEAVFKYLVNFYRATWMVLLTMAFMPPYRRAVPLLFCSCGCCPGVKVDPLPRKPVETSMMYKYADI